MSTFPPFALEVSKLGCSTLGGVISFDVDAGPPTKSTSPSRLRTRNQAFEGDTIDGERADYSYLREYDRFQYMSIERILGIQH